MRALILNSGMGSRMGALTTEQPKCMTELLNGETIISRQLRLIVQCGIREVIITTGYYENILVEYCRSLELPITFTFVKNSLYDTTNYIYSIYCAREYLNDDVLLMHGDLVFEESVLSDMLKCKTSCMKVSSTVKLPKKDFKAVVQNERVSKIGIQYFENAIEAQPLYKLNKSDWLVWLHSIAQFCEAGNTCCYAEDAYNEVSDKCKLYPYDVKDRLCAETDTPSDLEKVMEKLVRVQW